jgi:hypothetical protein
MKEGKQGDLFVLWEKEPEPDVPNAGSENVKFLVFLAIETSPSPIVATSSVAIVVT